MGPNLPLDPSDPTGERDGPALATPRLTLRRWRDADLAPFAQMNADAAVVEFFPRALTRAESDAMVARIEEHFRRNGFGLWAVEVTASGRFAGFVGLSTPAFDAPFMPAVEIGWRFSAEHWGHGYATEAATATVDFAFGQLRLPALVSFTVPANVRSRGVMERLGMRRDPADDFQHPSLAVGHPLRTHVLYRLTPEQWAANAPRT